MGTNHYFVVHGTSTAPTVARLGLAIALVFVLIWSTADASPWTRRSIADLEAAPEARSPEPEEQRVEEPAAKDDEPAAPVSRAEEALARLLEMEPEPTETATPTAHDAATERQIARLEGDLSVDADDVSRMIERNRVNRLLEQSDELTRQRQLAEAADLLQEALPSVQADRLQLAILHRLGSLYFRMRRFEEAEDVMARSLAMEPGNAALASNLAAVQMTIGYLDEALATLSEIQLDRVRNPQLLFSIHFNMACLHSMKEEVEVALDHLTQAAQHHPSSTLSSLGDPQLDTIRDDIRFRELQVLLESWSRQQRARPTTL